MARRFWTLGLTLVALGLAAPAAVAAGTTIEVTTAEDVDALTADADLALKACGGAGISNVNSLEETANNGIPEEDPAASQPLPRTRVTPCSFRLALLAASANRTVSTASARDTITFDPAVFADSTTALTFAPVPLPPVTEPYLNIDGCTRSAVSGPCVNVELPEDLVSGLLGTLPGSLVPQQTESLTVAAHDVVVSGFAFHNGDPAIWIPAPTNGLQLAAGQSTGNVSVTNSYFGLDTTGQPTADAPGAGILVSGDSASIGGVPDPTVPGRPMRNVFAQGDLGVLIAGASGTEVQGNWFGTGADGAPLPNPAQHEQLEVGVRLVGLGGDATMAGEALDEADLDDVGAAELEGVASPPGVNPAPDVEDESMVTIARLNKIGGAAQGADAGSAACDGPCNLFAGLGAHAIDVGGEPMMPSQPTQLPDHAAEPVGVESTRIQGNQIGLDAARASAGAADANILVRNGSVGTTIGGDTSGEMNEISNSRFGPGVLVEPGAGQDTRLLKNVGRDNSRAFFDLGDDGPGNAADGPNGGVQAPAITSAVSGQISGTAAPGRTVRVYRVPANGHRTGHGDIESFLGSVTATEAGTWRLTRPVEAGRLVSATVDGPNGTSELALNVKVAAPPEPLTETPREEEPVPPATAVTTAEPPSPPPPADEDAPAVIEVVGEEGPRPGKPIAASKRAPIAGRVSDPSGIRAVHVALAVPSPKKRSVRAKRRRPVCNFVNLKRARIVRRSCSNPLFFKARGTDNWKMPLNRRSRAILTRAGFVTLYLQLTDNLGNRAVRRYRIRFTRGGGHRVG
jgi:hypothetical protein